MAILACLFGPSAFATPEFLEGAAAESKDAQTKLLAELRENLEQAKESDNQPKERN